MPDNLTKTGKQDDQRINVNQAHEVAYWTKKLGVTPEELKKAVASAGPLVKDVQRKLKG